MSLVGNGVASQIIRVNGFRASRGRRSLAWGAWIKYTGGSGFGTISFWRQDLVLTPLQSIGDSLYAPWFDTSNVLRNLSGQAPDTPYDVLNLMPVGWSFLYFEFSERGTVRAVRYTPAGGAMKVTTNPYTFSPITTSPPTTYEMHVGGTEGGAETMPTQLRVAELMMLRRPLSLESVRRLAHDPNEFAGDLIFYLPLRSTDAKTVMVSGRSYALTYGTTSRQQIIGDHPPVERWRTGTRVFLGDTLASRLRAVDALRVSTSTNGAALRVGMR